MKPTIDQDWTRLSRLQLNGLPDLLALHWEEVGEDRAAMPLDVDWHSLRLLEHSGVLHSLGAWCGKDLVGYACFELCRPRLSSRTLAAFEVGLYISPEHRGFLGLALIDTAERLLRRDGVKVVSMSSRPAMPATGDLLVKLGYRPTELIHTKVLE